MTDAVYASTDESGNTGNDLFRDDQPFFWTGTIVSRIDLDERHRGDLAVWIKAVNGTEQSSNRDRSERTELKGSDLGYGGIQGIALDIQRFVEDTDLHFVFTRVEKTCVAGTKFVDALIDSGLNMGVSPLHYENRFFRLLLTKAITSLLSPKDKREFWEQVYGNGDCEKFCRILRRLKFKVSTAPMDPRMREVLLDAIGWGIDHPEPLLESRKSEMDAPNIVALGLLINHIQHFVGVSGLRVTRFIHDEQNQFAKTLRKTFDIMHHAKVSAHPIGFMRGEFSLSTVYDCPFEMVPSSESVGLQVIDVILWLMKRRYDGPWKPTPAIESLVNTLIFRSEISEFTYDDLDQALQRGQEMLASKHVTGDEAANARRILRDLELAKAVRMAREEHS